MKISVITVCLNASATLERAVASVCSQTHPDVEHIIVDGGSTDGTPEIIRKFQGRFARVIMERDQGIYDAMNKGVAAATGEVVYFLNADDAFHDSHVVSDVEKFFGDDQGRDLVYGRVVLEGAPNVAKKGSGSRQFRSMNDFLRYTICHQAVFAKRALFLKLGSFDLQYRYAADFDWLLKVYRDNPKGFVYMDRVVAYYHYQGRSYQQKRQTGQEAIRIIRRYFPFGIFACYWLRYVLIRGLKKQLLNEPW